MVIIINKCLQEYDAIPLFFIKLDHHLMRLYADLAALSYFTFLHQRKMHYKWELYDELSLDLIRNGS